MGPTVVHGVTPGTAHASESRMNAGFVSRLMSVRVMVGLKIGGFRCFLVVTLSRAFP
jgi:hypothetical protein